MSLFHPKICTDVSLNQTDGLSGARYLAVELFVAHHAFKDRSLERP
jgi:hypothetical protein